MASDPFDFSDVFKDLENKIDEFMHFDTTHEAASRIFADSTGELVYGKYTPMGDPNYDQPGYPVSRRIDKGGLGDWQNYYVSNPDKLTMTVTNETRGNTYWIGRAWDGVDGGYITDIIESGQGYLWQDSKIYHDRTPRPFMEQACDKFVDDYLLPTIHSLYFDD